MAQPLADKIFGVFGVASPPVASDDTWPAIEDDKKSLEIDVDDRTGEYAVPRFTVSMRLKSIVTAQSILAALAIDECPPPRIAAFARTPARVLIMLETSVALFGNTIH